MRIAILFFLTISALSFWGARASDTIDKTYTVQGDVTGDGTPETLVVRITGSSFRSPFTREFKVLNSNADVLFFEKETDSAIDNFFNDEGYVTNCKGYDQCKAKWYFIDVPKTVARYAKPSSSALFLTKEGFEQQMDPVAQVDLEAMKLTSGEIKSVLEEMRHILSKPGFFLIGPIGVPEGSHGEPRVWVLSIRRFVRCSQD